MKYDRDIYKRHSIRLKGYDYSQPGWYFITICAKEKECLFGDINDGKMSLNKYGIIVKKEWLETASIRRNMELDEFIIMPNHLHGIVVITDNPDGMCRGTLQNQEKQVDPNGRGTLQRAPTVERFGKPVSNSIPTIIRLFKSTTTKQINQKRDLPGVPVWQRNYYEHVIRNEKELNLIREYIFNNPLRWEKDEDNPMCRVVK